MKMLRGKNKPKKVKKDKDQVFVNFVLDETGSMEVCRDATISGFNEYIEKLKKDQPNIKFTLTKFDSNRIDVVYSAVPIREVDELNRNTYVPGALTPLYDAIAKTIQSMESMEKKAREKPVLCVLMTDGEENASREYTRDKICKLIKKKEKEGWTFAYLGSNQDAWAVGQSIGLHRGNVMNYNTARTGDTFNAMAQVTSYYADSRGAQTTSLYEDAGVDESDTTDNSIKKSKKQKRKGVK